MSGRRSAKFEVLDRVGWRRRIGFRSRTSAAQIPIRSAKLPKLCHNLGDGYVVAARATNASGSRSRADSGVAGAGGTPDMRGDPMSPLRWTAKFTATSLPN